MEPAAQKYRLGRILPDAIEVLPDKLPPTPPKRPLMNWRLLALEIARLGPGVSYHFDDDDSVYPPDGGRLGARDRKDG